MFKLNFLDLRQSYIVRCWGLVGVPIIEGKQSTLCGDSECGLLRCEFYESIKNGLAGDHAYGFGQARTLLLWWEMNFYFKKITCNAICETIDNGSESLSLSFIVTPVSMWFGISDLIRLNSFPQHKYDRYALN